MWLLVLVLCYVAWLSVAWFVICCWLIDGTRFGLRLIVLVLSFFDLWLLAWLCRCGLEVWFFGVFVWFTSWVCLDLVVSLGSGKFCVCFG